MSDNFLQHHGIKGQRWGERRFQNEDGSLTPAGRERYGYGPMPNERTVLKKGTRINTVAIAKDSEAYRKRGNWMYTYDPNNKWDRAVYNGPFSMFKGQTTGYVTVEHSYEVVKDLKMPTSTERFDEFVKLYEKNTKQFTKDLQKMQDWMKGDDYGEQNKSAQTVNLKKVKTDEDLVAAYKLFNHAMENVQAFKSTKMYADLMATKYDAMVDDNNQGVYNGVNDPIIIFRANEVLKTAAPARMNTVSDIYDNYYKVENELKKKGKRVAL